jgi:hypothetical protein
MVVGVNLGSNHFSISVSRFAVSLLFRHPLRTFIASREVGARNSLELLPIGTAYTLWRSSQHKFPMSTNDTLFVAAAAAGSTFT